MQAVEKLPFVFMDPLHLDVKHGVGVDLDLVVLFKMGSKLHLVLLEVEVIQGKVIRHKQEEQNNILLSSILKF